MKKILTLCIIHQPPRILLGMKKIKFGKGLWNGFGGHVEAGESIEDAATREVKEEAGITVNEIEKMGILDFEYPTKGKMEVHVFRAEHFTGEPTESDEMIPQWFPVDNLPYEKMWADDKYWLPMLLKGEKFRGVFTFDKYGTIDTSELLRVERLTR